MLKTPLKTLLDILINHFTKERLETLILQNDEKLLTFMLEHENANDYKNAFFKIIANSLVFNQKALLECLEIKELDRSFTQFKNKIGLFSQGGFLKSSGSVVLHFPFKTMFYSVTLKIAVPNLTSFFTMRCCIKKKLTRF